MATRRRRTTGKRRRQTPEPGLADLWQRIRALFRRDGGSAGVATPAPLPTLARALQAARAWPEAGRPAPAEPGEARSLRPAAAAADAAVATFQSGEALGVALVGSRGSGRSSLLEAIAAALPPELPRQELSFDERIRSEAQLVDALRKSLRLGARDLGGLADELLRGPRRVLLLDDVERLVLRTVAACEVLEAFLALLRRTGAHVGWVVAVRPEAWTWMELRFGIASLLPVRIEARLPNARALERVVLAPFEQAGVRVRFVDDGAAAPSQAELSRRCFASLHEATGGSPLGGWVHWLCHTRKDRARLEAPPFPVPDLAFVRDLDRGALLTLASLLQHGGLTGPEHAELFLGTSGTSVRLLDRLTAQGLLERETRTGAEERYDVNPVIAWRLAELLRAANVLP